MKLSELILTPQGRLSHTKFWANVAYLVASIAVLRSVWMGSLTADTLGVYLGAVALHGGASKAIALKYGAGEMGEKG